MITTLKLYDLKSNNINLLYIICYKNVDLKWKGVSFNFKYFISP